jgi:flagellar hook assembly protein FlgD
VTLEVFNILGREVRRIVDQDLPAGVHRVMFDGRSSSGNMLATGVYFYRLRTDAYVETKKMLLLK